MQKETLDKIRQSIYDRETAILKFNKEIEQLKKNVGNYEAKVLNEITAEIDIQTQKPRYSNAEKRQFELISRLSSDNYFQEASNTLQAKTEELALLMIELQNDKLEFRSYEIISRMTV